MSKNKVSLRKKVLLIIDFFMIVALCGLDFCAKWFVLLSLKGKGSFIILENVLQLTYKENSGGLFGFLDNQQLFIMFLSLIFFFPVFIILIKLPDSKKFTVANWMLTFILSGTIGNFFDRVYYKHAIDYIYFIGIDFPVFNLSDFYITLGTLVLLLLLIFYYKEIDLVFMNFKKAYFREIK